MKFCQTGLAGIFVMAMAFGLRAQDCHIALRGKVVESGSGEPLAYASVSITEIGKGAVCDGNGQFIIADLCEKTAYTIHIQHVQCTHFTQVVRLSENAEMTFTLKHDHVLNEVIVVEKAVAPKAMQAETGVLKADLAATMGMSLGETVRRLPGVSSLNTGMTISKPVIQGLHSNRIAIVSNGVTIEGQQWGTEHAPEVDPFTADRITVIKGVAGMRYGIGNLGGMVVVEPAPLRESDGFGGWAAVQGFSNGRGGVVSGSTDWHLPGRSLAVRLQGTFKRTGNLRSPNYFLWNTGVQELNFSGMAAWKKGRWRHELSGSRFNQTIGILRAAHIGNTTDLRRAIETDVPANNYDSFSYSLKRPFQRIEHNLGKYKGAFRISDRWKLGLQGSFQYNRRREFDAHKPLGVISDVNPKPQIIFNIVTNTMDAALEHNPIRHWQGGIGLQQQTQYNYVTRGGLIPDFLRISGGLWVTERWRRYPSPWEVEFGARYDYLWNHITDTVGSLRKINTIRQFASPSANAGLVYHFSDHTNLRLNSGLAWRPPHVNELFARGVHHGSATYEEGDPTLGPEHGWNNNLSFNYDQSQWGVSPRIIGVQVSLYYNQINQFIYLNPEAEPVLSIRGAFPAFTYRQADAILRGVDGRMEMRIWKGFSAEGRASILRATYWTLEAPGHEGTRYQAWLPLMPSDRYTVGLKWRNRKETYFNIDATTVLRQTRYPVGVLLKAPPDQYTLVGFNAGHTFLWGKQKIEAGLSAQNLLNTRYREYMDFFRFFVDAPGTNITVRAKWIF